MRSWLTKIITSIVLTWGRDIASYIVGLITKYFMYKKIEKKEKTQAEKVEEIANKIKDMQDKGLFIPEDLKNELRRESRKLVGD